MNFFRATVCPGSPVQPAAIAQIDFLNVVLEIGEECRYHRLEVVLHMLSAAAGGWWKMKDIFEIKKERVLLAGREADRRGDMKKILIVRSVYFYRKYR